MLFSRDTSPEARAVLLAALRRKTPAERARMMADAVLAARHVARAGVRRHSPEASAELQHAAFLRRWLGPELAPRAIQEWLRRRRGDETAGADGKR